MRKPARFTVLLVLLTAVAGVALAQGTTSELTGTVTSEGAPLPGVTVTVASPALQGTRTTVTGSTGGYTFLALPPGDYVVTFELEGLAPVKQEVRLSLAQTARADAAMGVTGVTEAVTVTGESAMASVLESTQVATNFTGEEIGKLPVARTIRDTVLLAPGVSATGVNNQITISGAPSYDNLFLVDGVVVNENLRGQPHALFIEDAIQETTILAGAVSAEYGRFTGGVVSTLTKSGGNEFHGSFRDSFSNPDWTDKTPWPTEADHVDNVDEIYEGTLGGRILKDHLWFFGGARLAERAVQRFTSQTNLAYANGFDEKRYEGKLTANITSRHTLYVSYLDITNDETNNAFTPIYDEASIVPVRGLPNTLLAINYNGLLGRNLVIEGQYTEKDFAFEGSGGRFTDRIGGTWIQDTGNNFGRYNAPVFCGVCTDEERNNDSWFAKARYFLDTGSLGGHTVVLGVEDFNETRLANNYQSASQYQITAATYINGTQINPRFDNTTRITYRPIEFLSTGTDFQTQSIFLNDNWALNRHFSFNLGLRYDKNDGKDASGNTVSDDDAFSPRLALAYDIRGDGRGRATASFNRYVAKIADGNVGGSAQAAGNPALYTFRYDGPVINPVGTPVNQLLSPQAALAQLFAWFDSVGGTSNTALLTQVAVPGLSTRFDEPITSPFVDEISVGYGTQIGNNAFAKVDLIARDWDAFYAARLDLSTGTSTAPNGSVGDVSFTENDDGSIKRKYRGVQFQGQWRPGHFLVGGTYTYATLKGNDQGEGAGTATIRNLPLATYYPEYLNYERRLPEGYLSQDVRHRARLWVGYDLSTRVGGFNVSVLQSYDTGTPYGAVGLIDASGRSTPFAGSPVNPGYTLSQLGDQHDYYFTSRDAFRTDDVWSTDVALSYNTPPILGVELFVRGVVTNLFNQSAVIVPNSSVTTRRTGGAASGLVAFNPMTDTPVEGTHWRKGTLFGQPTGPTSYQIPLTYGFGVGFRF